MSASTSVVLRRTLGILSVGVALSLPQPVSAGSDWNSNWGNNWVTQYSNWGNNWSNYHNWFDEDALERLKDLLDDIDWYDYDWDDHESWTPTRPPVSVPEPASLSLLVVGLVGLGVAGKRKRDE